jgi:hypothetical protein
MEICDHGKIFVEEDGDVILTTQKSSCETPMTNTSTQKDQSADDPILHSRYQWARHNQNSWRPNLASG